MIEFRKWYKEIRDWCIKYHHPNDFSKRSELYFVWRRALKWYQSVADECEKDCSSDEDYKVLYLHLKQVLVNELKESPECAYKNILKNQWLLPRKDKVDLE